MSAIVVDNLSKRYRISHQKRQDTLRDTLAQGVGNLFAHFRRKARADIEEFWALKDVSFAVEPGEVVGIIGRNGAGKSTLLKLLSRITEPTSGRITIRGRVASLLEVGTGFHPELSGRENIFLNGAILGMSKAEIRRNFDAIVAFAEVERFLDTPVKRYSSGMYVRLAFAVAAHLEPEILIVIKTVAESGMDESDRHRRHRDRHGRTHSRKQSNQFKRSRGAQLGASRFGVSRSLRAASTLGADGSDFYCRLCRKLGSRPPCCSPTSSFLKHSHCRGLVWCWPPRFWFSPASR